MPGHEENDESRQPALAQEAALVQARLEELKNKFIDVERRDHEYKQRQLALGDEAVALTGKAVRFTAVLALLGFLAGGIMLYQSSLIKQSSDAVTSAAGTLKQAFADSEQFFSNSLDQMTKLASAARDNASAATNAAKNAAQTLAVVERTSKALQDQFKRDQRAWIGVKEIRLSDAIAAQKALRFLIQVENTGKSPGQEVLVNAGNSRRMPAESDLDPPSAGGKYVIGPTGSYPFSIEMKDLLTDEDVSKLRQAVETVYVFGTIHYLDSFGEGRRTTFCAYYVAKDTSSLQWCDKYNRMQ